jgi:hypothetical protein
MMDTKRADLTKDASDVDELGQRGRAILNTLCPNLQERGVQKNAYVMVNLANSLFVTGRSADEAMKRFDCMHPGAEGWMQRFGEVLDDRGDSEAADCTLDPRIESKAFLANRSRLFAR